MEVVLDRFGRIVLPKRVRDDLGLKPGSILNIEETKEAIRLTPVEGEPHLRERKGVLVFSGKSAGDLHDAVQRHREERLRVHARGMKK